MQMRLLLRDVKVCVQCQSWIQGWWVWKVHICFVCLVSDIVNILRRMLSKSRWKRHIRYALFSKRVGNDYVRGHLAAHSGRVTSSCSWMYRIVTRRVMPWWYWFVVLVLLACLIRARIPCLGCFPHPPSASNIAPEIQVCKGENKDVTMLVLFYMASSSKLNFPIIFKGWKLGQLIISTPKIS